MFALYDKESGRIQGYQSNDLAPEGMATLDVGSVTTKLADTYYVSGGEITQRPTRPTFNTVLPCIIDLSSQPEGTTLTVTNAHGDTLTVSSWEEPLEITDAGRYTLQVTAPFPAHSFRQTIEVTNA